MWHLNLEHVSGPIEVNAVYDPLHQKYVRYLFQWKLRHFCPSFSNVLPLLRKAWTAMGINQKNLKRIDVACNSNGLRQVWRNSFWFEMIDFALLDFFVRIFRKNSRFHLVYSLEGHILPQRFYIGSKKYNPTQIAHMVKYFSWFAKYK